MVVVKVRTDEGGSTSNSGGSNFSAPKGYKSKKPTARFSKQPKWERTLSDAPRTDSQGTRRDIEQIRANAPVEWDTFSDARDSSMWGINSPNFDTDTDFSPVANARREWREKNKPGSYNYVERLYAERLAGDYWNTSTDQVQLGKDNLLTRVTSPQNEPLTKYPTLMAAAAKAGVNDQELKTLVSFSAAHRAATELSTTVDPARRDQIWGSMTVPQQMAVLDVLSAADALNIDLENGSLTPGWLETVGNALGAGANAVMEGLMWGNEQAMHVARTYAYAQGLQQEGVQNDQTTAAGLLNVGSGMVGKLAIPFLYWNATDKGQYDQEKLTQLKRQYGSKKVDVLLRGQQLSQDGEEDAFGRWLKDYADDPEALQIIDHVVYNRDADGELIALGNQIDSAHLGNLGYLVTNGMLPDSWRGNAASESGANVVNIAATFLLDPLIIGSKIRGAYMASRYGLHMLSNGATVDRAFQMRKVQRFFDTFGNDLARADNVDYATSAQRMAKVKQRYRNWFTEETIIAMRDAGVRDAATAKTFFKETDQTLALLRGQAIRRTPYVPHANVISNARRRVVGSRSIPTNVGASDEYGLNTARGATQQDRQAQAQQVIEVLKNDAEKIGAIEGVKARPDALLKLPDWANGGYTYSNKQVSARLDRFTRRFARMPNGTGGIVTSDASDAQRVYQYARAFLTRYHANIIREAWVDATPAQRKLMIQGLNRTAGYSKGIHLRDPVKGHQMIDEMSWGTRSTDQYSARIKGIEGEGVGEYSDMIGQSWARYAGGRSVSTGTLAQDERYRALGQQMARNIEESNALREQIRLKSATINLDAARQDLIALRKEAVRLSYEMRVVTGGTKDVARRTAKEANITPARRTTDTADIAARVDAQARQALTDARSIDRKIRQAEKRVAKGLPPGVNVAALKAERDTLRKNASYLFLRNKKLKLERERVKEMNADEYGVYDPSFVDGRSYAIFPWQATDRVAIPRWDIIEEMRVRTSVLDQIMGVTQSRFGKAPTDWWTILTLAAPRFSLRNSIEDYIFHALTRGSLTDTVRGRRFSTAVRDARGEQQPKLFSRDSGKMNLGMFNRNMRKVGDWANDPIGGPIRSFFSRALLPHMGEAEVTFARKAMQDGNMEPMRKLVAKAWLRQRMRGVTPGSVIDGYLDDLVTAQGFRYLDHVGDIARNLTDATLPGASAAWPGAEKAVRTRLVGTGQYNDILLDPLNSDSFHSLMHSIEGSVDRSRSIGKIAISSFYDEALYGPVSKAGEVRAEKAIARIAEEVETNPWYRQNMAILYEAGVTPEQFAGRFYYATRSLFSGDRDGRLNKALLEKIVQTRKDADGVEFRSIAIFDEVDGERKYRVSVYDLMKMDRREMPSTVLNQELTSIPLFSDLSTSDRLYSIMGEQNARLSREPMLIANYLEVRKNLDWYEKQLVRQGMTKESAREMVSKSALDHAFERTMMYTDNPEIRSLAAWNVRNIARFYRATEDFYRRASRLARTNPEGIWKAVLAYDVVGHSGFTYEDENGEKYFLYPGVQPIFDAVANGIGFLNGSQMGMGIPMTFAGKANMLTPSLDPKQWLPTFSGPLAAVPAKLILDRFPAAAGLERALLGEYGSSASVESVLFPPVVMRLIGAMSTDEREGQYASAYKNAIQIATAAGLAPKFDPTRTDASYQSEVNDYLDRVSQIARTVLWARFVVGPFLPASPQVVPDDVTDYARSMGVSSMRQGFLQLTRTMSFDEALVTWYRLNPDLAPYTVTKMEDGPKTSPLSSLRGFKETETWLKANSDLVERFPTASTFLAPIDGQFSSDTLRWLESMGFKQSKLNEDFALEVMTQEGFAKYSATRKDYLDYLAEAETPAERKELDAQWATARDSLYARYPLLQTRMSGGQKYSAYRESLVAETRLMLDFIYSPAGASVEKSETVRAVDRMQATFDDAMDRISQITGSTDAEDALKRNTRAEARAALEAIASEVPSARPYFENVLDDLIGG